ncbi:MAG TPA: hypothetical protein VGU71_08120 [Candidatus Dormibacteraeota bacterium]|nr:hypothetical protein [Candidatus Dormibacteraeota bacterium]
MTAVTVAVAVAEISGWDWLRSVGEARLCNRTGHHVAIRHLSNGPPLTLPPCGEARLRSQDLRTYDCVPWLQARLVLAEPIPAPPSNRGIKLISFTAVLLILTLLSASLLTYVEAVWGRYVAAPWASTALVGVASLLDLGLLIEIAVFGYLSRAGETTLNLMMRSFTVLVILFLGVAIPFFLITLAWDSGKLLTDTNFNSITLLVVQVLVVLLAAVAPAGLYFLFSRQRLDSLRADFLREVLQLDPNLSTLDEADTKYGRLLDEVYGAPSSNGLRFSLGVPLILCTLLLALGWTLVVLPVSRSYIADDVFNLLSSTQGQAQLFGFFGAYYFALNMAFRRYLRADLTTKAYSQISVRIIGTVLLVLAVSAIPPFAGAKADSTSAHVLDVLAFVVGMVPDTGLALISDFLKRRKLFWGTSLQQQHPVTELEGVSLYDSARLLEEGIESVESLATANLIELTLRTRIPASRLVDLFDQAVLYLHLCLGSEPPEPARSHLREFGIRTATDFERADRAAAARGKSDALYRILGAKTYDENPDHQTVPLLQVMSDAWHDDEWMPFLREWRRCLEDRFETLTSPAGLRPARPRTADKLAANAGQIAT